MAPHPTNPLHSIGLDRLHIILLLHILTDRLHGLSPGSVSGEGGGGEPGSEHASSINRKKVIYEPFK